MSYYRWSVTSELIHILNTGVIILFNYIDFTLLVVLIRHLKKGMWQTVNDIFDCDIGVVAPHSEIKYPYFTGFEINTFISLGEIPFFHLEISIFHYLK